MKKDRASSSHTHTDRDTHTHKQTETHTHKVRQGGRDLEWEGSRNSIITSGQTSNCPSPPPPHTHTHLSMTFYSEPHDPLAL